MVTISDIAKATGLSTATVSNALTGKGRVSESKRREVLETAERMGYDFSRVRGTAVPNRSIAIIVETLSISFCIKIAEGVWRAAAGNNCQVRLFNLDILHNSGDINPPREALRDRLAAILPQIGSDTLGIIYISQYPRDVTGIMPPTSLPVVYAYCHTSDGAVCVNTDDQEGAYMAVNHLLWQGKRNIAMISGPINSIPMTKRFSGYQRALIDAGLSVDLNYVRLGDWDIRHSRDRMLELLSLSPRPDGVFCQSDDIAIGVCEAIRKSGLRIPEDIAVVGFDNYDYAALVTPALTTIDQPLEEIGNVSYSQLMKLIEGTEVAEKSTLLHARLIRRQSA